MRVFCIVGTQLRHQYFLSRIAESFDIACVLLVKRSLVQPAKISSSVFSAQELEFERWHLGQLAQQERNDFGSSVKQLDISGYPIKEVSNFDQLNHPEVIEWAANFDADVLIDYGSGILSREFLDILPEWKINLHGGLSPWYKGSATLLWPLYFQQPELIGMTYHLLSKKIDGGDILQHCRPQLYFNDSASQIGCRAVIEGTEAGIKLLNRIKSGQQVNVAKQKSSGKLFLEKDYTPRHLKIVYQLLEQGLLKRYLDNKETYDSCYQFIDQYDEHCGMLKRSA